MNLSSKLYFSADIEASGSVPGLYSMLSLGFCVVGAREKNFYRELKPITYRYKLEALKVGSLGLRCLEEIQKEDPRYDPKSKHFSPRCVLRYLTRNATPPYKAMCELNNWVRAIAGTNEPIIAAAPASFDVSFISYYFAQFFKGQNPFRHKSEDINSFYRGVSRNAYAHCKDLEIPDTRNPEHNALEDAMHQAKEFEHVLSLIGYSSPLGHSLPYHNLLGP